MDTLKLAILAFIAGGIVLFMADVSMVNSILISSVVMTVVTIIAVVRYKVDPPKKKHGPDTEQGPTIK